MEWIQITNPKDLKIGLNWAGIRKTKEKGAHLIATKNLRFGTPVLWREIPDVSFSIILNQTETTLKIFGPLKNQEIKDKSSSNLLAIAALEQLNEKELNRWIINGHVNLWTQNVSDEVNEYIEKKYPKWSGEKFIQLRQIMQTNSFIFKTHLSFGGKFLGIGVYREGAYFNHSCRPNCFYYFYGRTLNMITMKDIKKGEELTMTYMSYGDIVPYRNRISLIEKNLKFKCFCNICKQKEKADLSNLQFGNYPHRLSTRIDFWRTFDENSQKYTEQAEYILKKFKPELLLRNIIDSRDLSYEYIRKCHINKHYDAKRYEKAINLYQKSIEKIGHENLYIQWILFGLIVKCLSCCELNDKENLIKYSKKYKEITRNYFWRYDIWYNDMLVNPNLKKLFQQMEYSSKN